MPYWAVFRSDNGTLRSHGTVTADPLPAGLERKDVEDPPGDKLWNTTTRVFEARPAQPARDLVTAFTEQPEVQALAAADRTKMQDALRRVMPDWVDTSG